MQWYSDFCLPAYEKFRNIAAPILFHIVVNITSLLLSWYGGFEWILGTEGKAVGITVLATLITVIIYVKIKMFLMCI